MTLPVTISRPYPELLVEIEQGKVKIPQFQRDFVWSVPDTARLMDSIVKGYPIGAFIFWDTDERLRSVRNLGGADFPLPRKGQIISYVLDGQQRLTSIYACMKGATVSDSDYSEIVVDLDASAEADEAVVVESKFMESKPDSTYIKMTDLAGDDFVLLASYKNHGKIIKQYRNNLLSYPFSIIQYSDTDISVATEIFTRINVGGKNLSTFQIMVAKTHDDKRKFDLGEKFEKLSDDLENVGYETIPGDTVLRAASAILCGECRKQAILRLPKAKFIDGWDGIVAAVKCAIDYFRKEYRIPVSRLLPYNDMLVPFACFFHKNGNKRPNEIQRKYLRDFFWRCALSERYSSALETKLGRDIKKMQKIYNGKLPSYDDALSLDAQWIKDNGHFSASRSFIKAILCLYAYTEPQSFDSGGKVLLGNDYLQRANSRNYHHFFPKGYLQGKPNEGMANHVLNITMVDESLNKRDIGKRAPSVYMKKFRKSNPDIAATMRTHLIDDLDEFGIWTDDYDAFLKERAKRVIAEIKKRIIPPQGK